jgi:ribonuclease D
LADWIVVEDEPALDALVSAARAGGEIALDTEFMRERTYRARLCLVQIATRDDIYLIEPDDLDLRPLAELIADPAVEVVVHAGQQDLQIFYEKFELSPQNVYDVQIAAGFGGFGASLPYGRLVSSVLGVQISKGESYSDWCRRPLSDAQKRYAADDVRYLLEARQKIIQKLDELGRVEWAMEEMSGITDPDAYANDPQVAWRRVGGRGTLSGRQLAVLRAVAAWREEAAAQRDLPRNWVVKDATLIEIARRTPKSIGALMDIRGMNAKEADRSGRDIMAAVAQGLEATPIESGDSLPRAAQVRARMLSGLADAIVRSRSERAGVATELVATRGELESVLGEVVSDRLVEDRHRILQGWRRTLAGEAVLELARGRIAVRAISEPPYVEEVPLD